METRLTAIDLFAGAGGLSEGFREAGFEIVAANDFDEFAAATFGLSHPETPFILAPVQEVSADLLLDTANLAPMELDVLLGGPPCQAFSVYNHQRGMHDDRSGLFREYLRIVEGLFPRFVVIENVTGILSIAGGHAVNEIKEGLQKLGYYVEVNVLKAEEYGVPQERRRVFFVGSRDSESITWPVPTHNGRTVMPLLAANRLPFVTVHDAISDLPKLGAGAGTEISAYGEVPKSKYQAEMREVAVELFNHVAPVLQTINKERLKHIPQGGSWRDIPFHLLPSGMKAAKRSDHTKRYGRLDPTGLASTILTKCDLHWGAYIHPDQERTITVREAARFQSFPDHIHFSGPRSEQYRQVGNAVPPRLARAVATSLREMAEATESKKWILTHAG